uniref:Peptidase M14 carboxypeptidase A domain-containing protein n=1 Tax=Hucho hucho TaxID=62062 RepID=A0A4W5LWX8_9TELE
MYTTKHTQWFYFRVRNMKASTLYCTGMRSLLYSEIATREKGEGWRRTASNIRYYHNQHHQAEQDNNTTTNIKSHSLTWTCQFPYDRHLSGPLLPLHLLPPAVLPQPPHLQFGHRQLLQAAGAVLQPGWQHCTCADSDVAGRRMGGEECQAGGGGDGRGATRGEQQLLVDAGIPGLPAVMPMLNPDGVVVGNYRCSLASRDLNRNYKTLLRDYFPCIWHTRNMVNRMNTWRLMAAHLWSGTRAHPTQPHITGAAAVSVTSCSLAPPSPHGRPLSSSPYLSQPYSNTASPCLLCSSSPCPSAQITKPTPG